MSEFAVEGAELKQMIRFARKQPVSFGVNPGKEDKNTLLGMHRLKAPSIIGKSVKADGEGAKVAFGTCEVEGKVLNLRCERTLPGLAKKVKRFLKLHKVPLNVVVMDEDGTVLEQDIEELPDDPSLEAEEEAATSDAQTAEASKAAQNTPDPAAMAQKLKAIQQQLKTLPTAAAEKLTAAAASAVKAIRSGDLETAEATIGRIEAALAKLAAQARQDLEPLRQRMEEAQTQIDQISDDAKRAKLQAAMGMVEKAVGDANPPAAEKALTTVETALKKLAAPTPPPTAEITVLADWQAAKDAVDDELRLLSDRLRKSAIPEVQGVADEVETLLSPLRTKMITALMGFQQAPTDAKNRDAALTALSEAEAWLASDPRVKAIDANPWGVPVTVSATLGGVLRKLQNDVNRMGRKAS
ncbi:hypothetical protein AB2B41_11860 [Marimonas sp. MJW-29]|uniref:Defence against restriction A N-terminal domain-containing protein n=2 Tax=Sulfitobacter sediminis TaxID=3234186 RepID=A0ABV3RN31_9RHOB